MVVHGVFIIFLSSQSCHLLGAGVEDDELAGVGKMMKLVKVMYGRKMAGTPREVGFVREDEGPAGNNNER